MKNLPKVKPRIGGTKPKWRPVRSVDHERVIDKVTLRDYNFGGHKQYTFYIEQWGDNLIATNEYSNKGAAKITSEQSFWVWQSFSDTTGQIIYKYMKNDGTFGVMNSIIDLLHHKPWERTSDQNNELL